MLLNYEPFSAADAFRLLDRFSGQGSAPGRTAMPMDVYRLGDDVVATFDLPGVDPGSIDVTVEGNALTIRAGHGRGPRPADRRPRDARGLTTRQGTTGSVTGALGGGGSGSRGSGACGSGPSSSGSLTRSCA